MILLHRTCSACPEQYDAYIAGYRVAYLRSRWDVLTVEMPGVGGEMVHEADVQGHELSAPELNAACRAILDRAGFPWAKEDAWRVVNEKPEAV
jgi:hypothetical protein